MIQEIMKAFVLIFIAEMGDKTQILAMAFATRFSVKKVLIGVFLGSLLNHGLAVLLGKYISTFIPTSTIQIIAGFAFVGFSLWTLKSDGDDEEEENNKSKYGPVVTVALAFFIGELGDKTQLTAITLAADAAYPFAILGGTVLGMIVTSGIGILIGKHIGDKIPEFTIKMIAASVFMFFGILKLYQNIPTKFITMQTVIVFTVIIGVSVFLLLRPELAKRGVQRDSVLRIQSRELYNYYHKASKNIKKICRGVDECGQCQGDDCIVGHTKTLIRNGMNQSELNQKKGVQADSSVLYKKFDREQVIEGLRITIDLINKNTDTPPENTNINNIRKNYEMILFGERYEDITDFKKYEFFIRSKDESIANRIFDSIER